MSSANIQKFSGVRSRRRTRFGTPFVAPRSFSRYPLRQVSRTYFHPQASAKNRKSRSRSPVGPRLVRQLRARNRYNRSVRRYSASSPSIPLDGRRRSRSFWTVAHRLPPHRRRPSGLLNVLRSSLADEFCRLQYHVGHGLRLRDHDCVRASQLSDPCAGPLGH